MRRSYAALSMALVAMGGVASACSSEGPSAPLGSGDTLHVDVDASALPAQQSSDANTDPDGIFAPVDGSSIYGSGKYDAAAYEVLSICSPPDASAASAGDGGKTRRDAGASTETDASAELDGAYAPGLDGGYTAGDAGCEAFPASCMAQPDCVCLLGALASAIPCQYPHCEVKLDHSGFAVYCPP
jgi:hypothetical protein